MDSSATGGIVSGDEKSTGGLVGVSVHPGGVIVGSTAGVRVMDTGRGDGLYIGGLVGLNAGPISDSHATGNVDRCPGGLGGLLGRTLESGAINRISGSIAGGTVTSTGQYLAGGLVGSNERPDQQTATPQET